MVFEFEYFWAILLLFIMERICCLQEQFDKDFVTLPGPQQSTESLDSHIEDFANRDSSLKLSFLRLCRLMHFTMLLTLVYFCDICLWFIMTKKSSPKQMHYRFQILFLNDLLSNIASKVTNQEKSH